MRTTLTIDDDILATAKRLAQRDHKSVGEVISAMAREGLSKATRSAQAARNGIPLLPNHRRAAAVTPELVRRLSDLPL